MTFADEWAANEERLLREADSLGELLLRMKGMLSPMLVGAGTWDGIIECARELPPTLAGFPLWLGVPIDGPRPLASLNVSVVGGTRAAAFLSDNARPAGSVRAKTGLAALLDATAAEGSPLQLAVGNRVLLQYDISPAHQSPTEPGFLLYPVRPTLAGGSRDKRIGEFGMALDAVTAAAGWGPDEAERRIADRTYLALNRDERIGAIGAFPGRERAVRITALGFSGGDDVLEFLGRSGWNGPRPAAASVLARLDGRGAFNGMRLGVRFDITAKGAGPVLEIQVFSANTIHDETGWFKDRECWNELIDALRKERLADAERLAKLEAWPSGARMLYGRSGPFALLQRIHHFAVTLAGDGSLALDAHAFLLLTRLPRRSNEPD